MMRPIDADALWSEFDLGSEREDYFVSLRSVRELIEAAHTLDVVPKWIKVEDELPAFDRIILLGYSDFKFVVVGYLDGEDLRWCGLDDGMIARPTHWMPLPEPPERD